MVDDISETVRPVQACGGEEDGGNIGEFVGNHWLNNAEFKKQVQDETVKKHGDVLKKLKQISDVFKECSSENEKFEFDWDLVYDLSSNLIEEYTREVDSAFNELDSVNKEIGQWQEGGFVMDSHRGVIMMNESEAWLTMKEKYLARRQEELHRSAKEIRETVKRLTHDNNQNSE
ncbi:hypothetical protein KAFR_0E04200 [Kazachstania africana CBS 2517]|uniref:Uncharacterized protein n=1 Tax=Kazachstania africana (strain ATCC 22294 / BCRC 22015 / CBS 2517 / CECT 1963 / NBRC 1671 / NRRL Y-8276) TaxID=1071382 RepID=H2AW21_KAZAF|nr:hypothetical protein KAFR_0E04200 [Kazachstania africana CBS 2517]CCF58571.1 hypothetical protein KAFR_0E04200 [Kazachstania africana CBS 2517]